MVSGDLGGQKAFAQIARAAIYHVRGLFHMYRAFTFKICDLMPSAPTLLQTNSSYVSSIVCHDFTNSKFLDISVVSPSGSQGNSWEIYGRMTESPRKS